MAACDIEGSSDSSIKNPIPNDIKGLIEKTKINQVFVTGKKALELYNKLCLPTVKINPIYLPSPSPANQAISYENLKSSYSVINNYLK